MKISASKKQLAKIISENGGWRDVAKFSAQDYDGDVFFYKTKPTRFEVVWRHDEVLGGDWINCGKALPNWHQTVLASDEYFHLYPAPDADGWIEWKGGERPVDGQTMIDVKFRYGAFATSGADCFNFTHDDHKASDIIAYRLHKPENNNLTQVGDTDVVESKPTIEQLAAEYRNRKDYAERKQQEADAAKAEAEAKLAELVAAGKAVGLAVSVAAPEPESELVITDWRDLRIGDEVEYVSGTVLECSGMVGFITEIDVDDPVYRVQVSLRGYPEKWCSAWRFIRRPAKGG